MRRIGLLLVALLSGAALTAPAAGVTQARQCFWASQVTSFSDAGQGRALVHIGRAESWELTLSRGCPGVDWAQRIGIRARGGERICAGRPAELLIPNASESGFQRCLVREVRMLPPEAAKP